MGIAINRDVVQLVRQHVRQHVLYTRLERKRGVTRLFNQVNEAFQEHVVQLLFISQTACFATVDSP